MGNIYKSTSTIKEDTMKVETQAKQYFKKFTKSQLLKKLDTNLANLRAQVGTVGEEPIRRNIDVIERALDLWTLEDQWVEESKKHTPVLTQNERERIVDTHKYLDKFCK
jgi:hypothetical protein